jgi:hypothetical protein
MIPERGGQRDGGEVFPVHGDLQAVGALNARRPRRVVSEPPFNAREVSRMCRENQSMNQHVSAVERDTRRYRRGGSAPVH